MGWGVGEGGEGVSWDTTKGSVGGPLQTQTVGGRCLVRLVARQLLCYAQPEPQILSLRLCVFKRALGFAV